ncbi:putative glycosyl transferase [Cesiribacter andamanensis AMV16]|uniref:Putative glycosyl transferase n=2 Tax=Cesiribacter TaxID=1133570 RepID=M7NGW2_9BACT|nr:putative glycosyl transferase [Cesiribacter andamanensis AMV16]
MVPVYNCAGYLTETLESVLVQDPGREQMQIVVVDDASTDADVAALVQRVGAGRITYHCQPKNVGSLRNFETCLNLATGHYIHLLHGDDKVLPGYYEKIGALLDRYPEAGAAFSRYQYIDEDSAYLYPQQPEQQADGLLSNWLVRLGERQRIQYCAISVRRSVYEELGGFYGVTYGEDWEMWMRIARRYAMAYTPEVLSAYRMHYQSISGQSFVQAKNLHDLQWVMNTIHAYLPDEVRGSVRRTALRFYAHYALKIANRIWHRSYNRQTVKAQIQEALRMHQDPGLYWKIAKLYTKMMLKAL